jgi:hypothetical protein
MESSLSDFSNLNLFFSQFMEQAGNEHIGTNFYANVVDNFQSPEFSKKLFFDLFRYCKPLITHLLEDPTYHPRSFFYIKDNAEYFVRFTCQGNVFDNRLISETHDSLFSGDIKTNWNNIKTIWCNILLYIYLNQLYSTKIKETELLDDSIKQEVKQLYLPMIPKLEDVTECLDSTFFKPIDQVSQLCSNCITDQIDSRFYVKDLLRISNFQVMYYNVIAFKESLDPEILPRVITLQDSIKYVYPGCEEVVVPAYTVLWSNLFDRLEECQSYTSDKKMNVNTSYRKLSTWYKKLDKFFDAFLFRGPIERTSTDSEALHVYFNSLSDRLSKIVCVFKTTPMAIEGSNYINFSFQTYRGKNGFDQKQRIAPLFLFLNGSQLLHLLPKLKLNKSVIQDWKNQTIDVDGFPFVKISNKIRENISNRKFVFKSEVVKEEERVLLLNIVFSPFEGPNTSVIFPNTFRLQYREVLNNYLLTPFLPLFENSDLIENLNKLLPLLQLAFNTRVGKFKSSVFIDLVSNLQNNPSQLNDWRVVLQEVSNVTQRFVCVFYADFETNNFDFEVFDPSAVVEKVVYASLYVLVLFWEQKCYYYFLYPMLPKLDKGIIDNWKKGLNELQENSLFKMMMYISNPNNNSATYSASNHPNPFVVEQNEYEEFDDLQENMESTENIDYNYESLFYFTKQREYTFNVKRLKIMKPFTDQINILHTRNVETATRQRKKLNIQFENFDQKNYKSMYNVYQNFLSVFKEDFIVATFPVGYSNSRFRNLCMFLPIYGPSEIDESWLGYVMELFNKRYCYVLTMGRHWKCHLFFAMLSHLLQRSIYLFVKINTDDDVKTSIQFYNKSNSKGCLYFALFLLGNQQDLIKPFEDILIDPTSISIHLMFPIVPQISNNVFLNFLNYDENKTEDE